jgi:Fur family ferric uptake transcriptional regulator
VLTVRSSSKAKALPNLDELRDRIRKAGLRSTGSRISVLRTLETSDHPLSHPEMVGLLADAGYDQATVYRNLCDMTDAGLLARTDLGDHVWRFEVKRGGASHSTLHPHFVCMSCGTVECLPDCKVQVGAGRGAPKAVRRQTVAVQLQGRCDDCERRA